MWRACISLFFFLLCWQLPAAPQDRWFLIPLNELESIEKLTQDWETSRLKLQESVSALRLELLQSKAQSAGLSTESKSLNESLARERQLRQSLRKSFDEYEAENSLLNSSLQSENSRLGLENRALDGKLSWWRLLALTVIVVTLVCAGLLAWFRFWPFRPR